jgi:hypothetical protein
MGLREAAGRPRTGAPTPIFPTPEVSQRGAAANVGRGSQAVTA